VRGGGPDPGVGGVAGQGLQRRRPGLLGVAGRRGAGRPLLAGGLLLDQPRGVRGVRAADRPQEVLLSQPQTPPQVQYGFVNDIYNFFYSGAMVLCSVGEYIFYIFLNVRLSLILDELFWIYLSFKRNLSRYINYSTSLWRGSSTTVNFDPVIETSYNLKVAPIGVKVFL